MSGLYEYQKQAVNKLRTGSILCGGVGTGKSRTSLAYFTEKVCGGYSTVDDNHVELRRPKDLYVITTAKKRDSLDWEGEASKFLITPGAKSVCRFVVDSWNNIGKYSDISGAFFIFDEQRTVGKGQWSKVFVKIARKNDWIVLTATPGDTWMDYATVFIANGYYKNRTQFYREHVVFNRYAKFPKIDRYVNTGKLEHLRRKTVVTMDTSKKTTRHHQWIKVGYDEDSYSVVKDRRWNPFEEKPIRNASEYCSLCRKIVNSDERRAEALRSVVKSNRKLILFYSFDYELEIIERTLRDIGVPFSEWNGHRHQDIPDTDEWVYVLQYSAGAEGWECIETNVIAFYSLQYSYKILEQACGRIDRLNTRYRDLYYYHLFSDAPIDEAIRKCIKKKVVFNEKTFAEM